MVIVVAAVASVCAFAIAATTTPTSISLIVFAITVLHHFSCCCFLFVSRLFIEYCAEFHSHPFLVLTESESKEKTFYLVERMKLCAFLCCGFFALCRLLRKRTAANA